MIDHLPLLDLLSAAASADPAGSDDDDLLAVAVGLEAARCRLDAAQAHVLAELERRGTTARELGLHTGPWLAREARLPVGAARERVRVAVKLATVLPGTGAALTDGRISWDHAAVLARAANPRIAEDIAAIEAELVDAAEGTVFEVWRRQVAGRAEELDQDGGHDPNRDLARNRLSASRTFDGSTHVSGLLTGEYGAVAAWVIDAHADRLFHRFTRDHKRHPEVAIPPRATLRALAFAEICRLAGAPRAAGSPPAPDDPGDLVPPGPPPGARDPEGPVDRDPADPADLADHADRRRVADHDAVTDPGPVIDLSEHPGAGTGRSGCGLEPGPDPHPDIGMDQGVGMVPDVAMDRDVRLEPDLGPDQGVGLGRDVGLEPDPGSDFDPASGPEWWPDRARGVWPAGESEIGSGPIPGPGSGPDAEPAGDRWRFSADGVLPRPEVLLVLHADRPGEVYTDDGIRLPGGLANPLLADPNLYAVVTNSLGEPLDLGRQVRLATAAQRRAIRIRDGGCIFPGCDVALQHCDIHHVIPWDDQGPTDLRLLAGGCRHHHGVWHRHGWVMRATPDAWFWWQTPAGRTFWSQRHGRQRPDPPPKPIFIAPAHPLAGRPPCTPQPTPRTHRP